MTAADEGDKGKQAPKEHWKHEPEDHDFPAAANYLSLVLSDSGAKHLSERFRSTAPIIAKAKDLLRASELPLLPPDNAHVAADLAKVKSGEHLSPVLIVRGDVTKGRPLVVADGYHRICASYHIDENANIPCVVVELGDIR